jgi:HK97 gp10 family phage protein
MGDGISFKISGGAELARLLEEKPPAVARQIIRRSLRVAVSPWREEMIARVRKGWHVFGAALEAKGLRAPRGGRGERGRQREFGVIAANIRISTKIGASGFEGSAAVMPSKRAFWARFLEFGTKHARAFPFIRPAFETRKQEVLDKFMEDVREQLRDELRLK